MAAIAGSIQKILRHVPLIGFKYGANQSGSAVHASKESKGNSKPITETPKKFRRRPLTQDEIDPVTTKSEETIPKFFSA